jgi:hypothetical protein
MNDKLPRASSVKTVDRAFRLPIYFAFSQDEGVRQFRHMHRNVDRVVIKFLYLHFKKAHVGDRSGDQCRSL